MNKLGVALGMIGLITLAACDGDDSSGGGGGTSSIVGRAVSTIPSTAACPASTRARPRHCSD